MSAVTARAVLLHSSWDTLLCETVTPHPQLLPAARGTWEQRATKGCHQRPYSCQPCWAPNFPSPKGFGVSPPLRSPWRGVEGELWGRDGADVPPYMYICPLSRLQRDPGRDAQLRSYEVPLVKRSYTCGRGSLCHPEAVGKGRAEYKRCPCREQCARCHRQKYWG